MSDTYTMKAHCRNCGDSWLIQIPKGITAISKESTTECEHCGCNSITIKRPSEM